MLILNSQMLRQHHLIFRFIGVYLHLKFFFFRKVLDAYLLHLVNSKKVDVAELILSTRFQKVPDDLKYYSGRLDQIFQQAKILFSHFKLYTSIHRLLELGSKLPFADLDDEDLDQVCHYATSSRQY